MDHITRPFLVIYVAWHPLFAQGSELAKKLYDHYRRSLYDNVTGGAGLSVLYRYAPEAGSALPLDIDFEESATAAVVLLLDEHWCADPAWVTWARTLLERSDEAGLRARVFPVTINAEAMHLEIAEQAIKWHEWHDCLDAARFQQLRMSLTYQFCRMLRVYLEGKMREIDEEEQLTQYLRKVEVFLSHSKHDNDGIRIAMLIRQFLCNAHGFDLGSFFDVHDIPPGVRFHQVILNKVRTSAVIAIHTDSYSSREWCRREIIEAKRSKVPLIVANCLTELDEHSFPYLGNVPIVRMDPVPADRVPAIIGHLLDEVLKDFLWRCRTQALTLISIPNPVFWPRLPELISLAGLSTALGVLVVYPDPPLGAEEQRLFAEIAPNVELRSITEWTASITV